MPLSEGEFVSYILGAPDFVTQPFRELYVGGAPLHHAAGRQERRATHGWLRR